MGHEQALELRCAQRRGMKIAFGQGLQDPQAGRLSLDSHDCWRWLREIPPVASALSRSVRTEAWLSDG